MRKVFPLILLIIIIIPLPVFSLGISPPIIDISYSPGQDYNITIISRGVDGQKIQAEVNGDFAESITIPSEKMIIKDGETRFEVHLKQPTFDTPGTKTSYICATESPDKQYGQSMINALVSVCSIVRIFVPYPEKYIEFSISIPNINEKENLYLKLRAISRGIQTVEHISGSVSIYDAELNTLITTVPLTDIFNLATDQEQEMYGEWSTINANSGTYKAVASLVYDGKTATKEQEFKIGTLDINLINYTSNITAGQIRPFNVEIESKWNEPIKNTFAEVTVFNNQSTEIQKFKTSPVQIKNAFGSATLNGFIDATNFNQEKYDIKINIFFDDNEKEYDGEFIVEYTAKNTNLIIGTVAIILSIIIIIAGAVFIAIKRLKNEK